jgi:hypothetical protein
MSWKGFLGELATVRRNDAQLSQYVAVMAQLRRSLDDWIPAENFGAFRRLAAAHQLVVEADCVFKPLAAESAVVGLDRAPTTRAVGAPYEEGGGWEAGTHVHAVVSTRADWATETLASAWYPLVVDGRMVLKPHVDHRRLGYAFGYPACCVDFFMTHNNWTRLNTLADAVQASERLDWRANCLLKQTPWMTIFHMPCSFDCPATVEYSTALLSALERLDAGYADKIRNALRQHFLVIGEAASYALEGARKVGPDHVFYETATFVGARMRYDRYSRLLSKGNELTVRDGVVFVWRDGQLVETLETRCDRGIVEVPMVLSFE